MSNSEKRAYDAMTDSDWAFTLSTFSSRKVAELMGCSVDVVRRKRKELGRIARNTGTAYYLVL